MINVTVAQCKAVMDTEEKDFKSMILVMAALAVLSIVMTAANMGFWTVLPMTVLFACTIPLIEYYQKWSKRIRDLLEIAKNVPGHIDF